MSEPPKGQAPEFRLRPPVIRGRIVRSHVWWQHRWPAGTRWGWLTPLNARSSPLASDRQPPPTAHYLPTEKRASAVCLSTKETL